MTVRTAIHRSVPAGTLPDFAPVPRKVRRHDGWTPERQRAFIEALADTSCVAIAARMVNMSPASVYQLRSQPGAESFRAAMDAAQTLGLQVVKDEAFHRAMQGELIPVRRDWSPCRSGGTILPAAPARAPCVEPLPIAGRQRLCCRRIRSAIPISSSGRKGYGGLQCWGLEQTRVQYRLGPARLHVACLILAPSCSAINLVGWVKVDNFAFTKCR